ncbi:hypothetical protein BDY19DRAFT_663232 [Irpex rosettiformis]|uniref:Uncharacterized protein n=1 Tax=Irpex rosettiformis TaxID=378272 RepID=A0ACB8U996_9APHY|nr:hypothetical protein BDY19DRAFT_663232 [Irpex rosettiformis]
MSVSAQHPAFVDAAIAHLDKSPDADSELSSTVPACDGGDITPRSVSNATIVFDTHDDPETAKATAIPTSIVINDTTSTQVSAGSPRVLQRASRFHDVNEAKACLYDNPLARGSLEDLPLYSSDDDSDDAFFFNDEADFEELEANLKNLSVDDRCVEGGEDSLEWISDLHVELLPCDDSEDNDDATDDLLPLELVTRAPTNCDLPRRRVLERVPRFRNADEMRGQAGAREERRVEECVDGSRGAGIDVDAGSAGDVGDDDGEVVSSLGVLKLE